MTPEKLTEQIKKKAAAEVSRDIQAFKIAISGACRTLGVECCGYSLGKDAKTALRALMACESKGWPAHLWRQREERLLKEVLSTMDTLQNVLLAKDEPSEFSAEEDE